MNFFIDIPFHSGRSFLSKVRLPLSRLPVLLTVIFLVFSSAYGENSNAPAIVDERHPIHKKAGGGLIIPYIFSTDSLGVTVGIGGGKSGLQNGQAGIYGSVFTTSNRSTATHWLGNNIELPFGNRLFLDVTFSAGWYAEERDYLSGNPNFANERAGANDSDPDNYVESSGDDIWGDLRFKYILPMGHAKKSAVRQYTIDRGILASGGTNGKRWNPFRSGVTFLQLKPFYRYRSFEFKSREEAKSTNGLDIGIVHNNTDYPANPSTGGSQRLKVIRDFGWFSSMNSWTVVKGEFSHHISLGETESFRQRVVALNLWASDNISLDSEKTPEGLKKTHRAPSYMGSSLGGFYRMRAYPHHRFTDKTAIYYGAEARLIPDWNPFEGITFLSFLDIKWIQFVGFLEAGRVDTSWSDKTFYEDLHSNAGIGLRIMARKAVGRFDVAVSEDGIRTWVMIGQAF